RRCRRHGRRGGGWRPGAVGPLEARVLKRRAGVRTGQLQQLLQGQGRGRTTFLHELEDVIGLQQGGHVADRLPQRAQRGQVGRDGRGQVLLGRRDVDEV